MNIVLGTAGQQAIMDAKTGGYLLDLGYVRLYRTGIAESSMPLVLTTALVNTNPQNGWTNYVGNISAIDEYNPVSPDVFHVVANIPTNAGDFQFDAVAVYLSDNTLLGIGTYERLLDKVSPGVNKTGNLMELEIFIRHASISEVINVTRALVSRPYSRITEFANSDLLGKASENSERIYRITRPTNALNDGNNNFTTFLVHAGSAFFDNTNKPYQKDVWVPSDHLSMFGGATLRARAINATSVSLFVPKATYPMIEHIIAEVPYLLATTQFGSSPIPNIFQGGLLLESVLSTVVDTDPNQYEFVFQLLNTTVPVASRNLDFGITLYASNTDLSAQTAIRVALKKFLEFQYDIGRTYESDQSTDPNLVLKPFLGYDTYWRKLDGLVMVATSTTDGRFSSPGQLYDLPDYATGGEQLLAPTYRATNMWLRYDPASSGTITYQLGTDRTTVNEGGTINVTLLTTGLVNGSLVGYTITGIQQEDLSSGSLTGFFTVNNNTATLAFGIAADQLTEGPEIFTISINADPNVKASVTINDTSITQDIHSFYAMDANATSASAISSINEGQSCYHITTVVGIAEGTYLYPKISSDGSADQYDLSQAIPVSVRISGGRASFAVAIAADKVTEGSEILTIGLYSTLAASPSDLVTTASITINDTSTAPTASMYFYTDTVTPNPPSVAQVNEGQYVYLNIATTGYASGTTFALEYPTEGIDRPVGPSDFATARPTTVTINAQGRATVAYFLANDNATEEYPGGIDTETFAVQLKEIPVTTAYIAQAQVLVKDTSKLSSGSFSIIDITDSLNPVPFFNSESDQLSNVSDTAPGGSGLTGKYYNVGTTFPLDVCLMIGHRYRLIWIQGATATTAVTRASCGVFSGANYGAGLGTVDNTSTTSGKALSMISDGATPLGYGAIFEFTIGKVSTQDTLPISMPFIINIYTYYPDGVPGFSSGSSATTDKWALAKSCLLNHKENNDTVKIKNLYSATDADWTSFCSKEVTVPFGAVADLFVVLPSGSGATSSLASSGTGNDGAMGHDFNINFPKYLGLNGMFDSVPVVTPDTDELMFPLLNALGGDSGKGQLFSDTETDLGGLHRSNITVDPTGESNITALLTSETLGLFGKDSNRVLDFDVVCEIVSVINGKDWQLGKSTNADHGGGLGILPSGVSDTPANYRGGGGKGGDTVGTGSGYGGGGSSGAIVHIRLGTKVNTEGFTPSTTVAPVSFFISDQTTIAKLVTSGTTPLPTGFKSFDKATTPVLSGSNAGSDGSEFYIAQVSYEANAKTVLDKETLVGGGTARCFVRPTHNDNTFPTLPLRNTLAWNKEQLQQITVPKLGVSRVVINATGVEGQYVDESSATVNGLPSKATNALTSNTVSPGNTANETVGNTFVFFAGANANVNGASPIIQTSKLSVYQNLMVSNYRTSNGTDAVANGDNEYSRGGFIEMYLSNYNTKAGSLFVELPRVALSEDNPERVEDTDNYLPDTWWSDTADADGNAISSKNYMLSDGDGALSVQPYMLSNIVKIRPWIKYGMKDINPTDKNVPIILQQGQAVTLIVVGGGGEVSTREPDPEVTTPDTAFKGNDLLLQIKGLSNNTYTTFLTCIGGLGSIDNSTNPTAATVPTYNATPLSGLLTVIGTPELLDGVTNPIKVTHGGVGSGSYAKITLLNQNPIPVTIRATGGKGGSAESILQVSDGVILVTAI